MGTFSTSVSKNVNANQANSASQTEILVAGSTTVDPITRAAATLYSEANPGVKVTSQAIASGAGIQAVGNGVADIGASSDAVSSVQMAQFPNLQTYQIGMGAIVVITNKASPANSTTVPTLTYADLQGIFNPTVAGWALPADFNANTVTVIRADSSGTSKVFFSFLGYGSTAPTNMGNPNWQGVNGNAAVVSTVGATPLSIGYADYGDVVANTNGGANNVMILPYIDGTGAQYQLPVQPNNAANALIDWNMLRNEAKYINSAVENPTVTLTTSGAQKANSAYAFAGSNMTLIRNLWYVTNGQPSSDVKNFITYVQTGPIDPTTKMSVFQETNNFGMPDIA
jgi:phosphate transport system substrate-binding protein